MFLDFSIFVCFVVFFGFFRFFGFLCFLVFFFELRWLPAFLFTRVGKSTYYRYFLKKHYSTMNSTAGLIVGSNNENITENGYFSFNISK